MSPDHPNNPPIGGKNKNPLIMTRISKDINFWIIFFILVYIVGLAMYTWIGKKGINKEQWDLFYFYNENYLKVIIPFLIARILTIKFLKTIFYGLAAFQFIAFSFSLLKLLHLCSNILLYKILTLTGILILMGMIYVSIRKLRKE
jgi:hypothetical protein